jgi:hypothetical protein
VQNASFGFPEPQNFVKQQIRKISAIFWEASLKLLISATYVTFPIHICRQFTPEISALDAIVPKPGQNYVAFLHASAIPFWFA